MEPLNLSPSPVKLLELLRRFHEGEYQLPAFQRPFVWKIRQTLNLLDSLLRGYPISVIYLWEPGATSALRAKTPTFSSRNGPPQVDRFKAFVIDGQQRLTSLHAAFGLAEAFDARNGRSLECWLELCAEDKRDGKITSLFQSPAQKRFLTDIAHQQKSWRVSLRELKDRPHQELRQDRAEQLEMEGYEPDIIARALRRIDAAYAMLSTHITCITITQSEDDEVLQVFKRLNRGGTGLRERDVRAADLGIGKSVEVLQEMQAFVSKPVPTALGFGFSFAFRSLVVFHKGTAQFNTLSSSWANTEGDRGQSLRDSWREAEQGLISAMAFVDDIGWFRKPLLPSLNALIPLAYALKRMKRDIKDGDRDALIRWFSLAALRGVFQGNVETTINKHLRNVNKNKNPALGLMDSLTANEARIIKAEEFMREPTTLWGPFTQVMFAWLVSMNAKDWMTGQPLVAIARQGIGMKNPEELLTVQHIFPRKLLASQEYEQDQANYPANFAIIGRSPNSSLKDLPPSEAMQRLDTHERREVARVQFFSKEAGDLLESNRYDDFLAWRSKRLAEAWNSWLGL